MKAALAAACAASMLLSSVAWSQASHDKLAAEALFDEGRRLMADGKFAAACDKLEASQRLDAGIGTLFYLADCYEKAGRTASAWVTFKEAAAAARSAGQADREAKGRAHIAQLEPKLFKVEVDVAEPDLAGLEIRRGPTIVKKEVFGVPVPVDPGTYEMVATAPGRKSWKGSLEVPTDAGARTVTVPRLEEDPTQSQPPLAPTAVEPPPPLLATAEPAPDTGPPGHGQRYAGIAMMGIGAVGLGIGVGFSVAAVGKNNDAAALCDGARCRDPRGEALSNSAKTDADVATAAFLAGGAMAVGGLVVILTAPRAPKRDALTIAPSSRGLLVRGTF